MKKLRLVQDPKASYGQKDCSVFLDGKQVSANYVTINQINDNNVSSIEVSFTVRVPVASPNPEIFMEGGMLVREFEVSDDVVIPEFKGGDE